MASSVPVILFILGNRERAKRDMDKRHAENQKLLEEIAQERKYIPPHGHKERSGPLTADGIWPGPDAGNR